MASNTVSDEEKIKIMHTLEAQSAKTLAEIQESLRAKIAEHMPEISSTDPMKSCIDILRAKEEELLASIVDLSKDFNIPKTFAVKESVDLEVKYRTLLESNKLLIQANEETIQKMKAEYTTLVEKYESLTKSFTEMSEARESKTIDKAVIESKTIVDKAVVEPKPVHSIHPLDADDPIFQPETRKTIIDIKYPVQWEMYKKQFGLVWQVHEVKLDEDYAHWIKLTSDEQHFIKMVLAFFGTSDLLVNENLAKRFIQEIKPLEMTVLYDFQKTMENVHSEMYGALLNNLIRDPTERTSLLNAIETIPTIKRKAEWVYEWMSSDRPFAERLVAFSIVEGIFFSGSFCAIYWLKERGVMPGVTLSNDFISRDEGMHVETAVSIHKLLRNKITADTLKQIIISAVSIEIEFINQALPCKLIGMNSVLMAEYIKFVANRICKQYEYDEVYQNVKNPFPFMDRIGLTGKSNFFERRPTEYNKLSHVDTEDPFAGL